MMKKNREAVSPVVGVMLMLVATIIIAAVVSGFAGGMTGDIRAAPNAMFDVKIDTVVPDNMGGVQQVMSFEQLSGDRIATKDLQIITYHTCSNGTIIKMINDAKSAPFTEYGKTKIFPTLNDVTKVGYSGNNPLADFGNYTLTAGDIMAVRPAAGITQFLGFEISEGDIVDVKILHIPSEKYVYDREVIVI